MREQPLTTHHLPHMSPSGRLEVLGGAAVRRLTHTGREVPPSGLKPNSLTRGVIGEGQTTDRINHMPNFFHFNNHHSTIINPMEKMQSGGLRTPADLVSPSGLLRVLGGPQSGGLRTPAEKCRPPG